MQGLAEEDQERRLLGDKKEITNCRLGCRQGGQLFQQTLLHQHSHSEGVPEVLNQGSCKCCIHSPSP